MFFFSQFQQPKIYNNIRYAPRSCSKNQTEFPFHFDPNQIRIVGGVNNVLINMKIEVSRDMFGPFKVSLINAYF
jgi:hypothetical protein